MTAPIPSDLWQRVLDVLKKEMPEQDFDLWLQPIHAMKLEGSVLHLEVPNRFYTEQLKKGVEHRIGEILKELTQQDITVSCSIAPERESESPSTVSPDRLSVESSSQEESPSHDINLRYTFANFVVGPSNRFAYTMAQAVVKEPGRHNPLVIYGGVGLGKTHLMCAVKHSLNGNSPNTRVLYATAEQFLNEYIESIQKSRLDAFRTKYRNLDYLLIDDVQFIINRGRSEEEFTHTFNTLFESRKQIVISSDRPPSDMTPMERRLISRLEWGVVTDIKPPELEMRIAILRNKAEAEKVHFPDDVINYIAGAIKTNIRQLEGSLARVAAYSSMMNQPPSVDMAKELLRDVISLQDNSTPASVDTIQRVVSRQYSLDVRDLKSKHRTDAIAFPRQLAMYLCLTMANKSTTEVGEIFGGRDHSTVIYARNKIKARLDSDPFFSAQVNKIIEEIRSSDSL